MKQKEATIWEAGTKLLLRYSMFDKWQLMHYIRWPVNNIPWGSTLLLLGRSEWSVACEESTSFQLSPLPKGHVTLCLTGRKEACKQQRTGLSSLHRGKEWTLSCNETETNVCPVTQQLVFDPDTSTLLVTHLSWSKCLYIWTHDGPLEGAPAHVWEESRPLWGSTGVERKTWNIET